MREKREERGYIYIYMRYKRGEREEKGERGRLVGRSGFVRPRGIRAGGRAVWQRFGRRRAGERTCGGRAAGGRAGERASLRAGERGSRF